MKKFTLRMIMAFTVFAFSLTNTSCSNESIEDSTKKDTNPSALTLDEAEKQQDPTSKAANVYTIKKYVFNRSNGASGLGHVGVAFELKATINGVNYTSFYQGSVEGTNGLFNIPNPFTAAGNNNGGWWNQVSTQPQMIAQFKSRGYTSYKFGQSFLSTTQAISNNSKAILANFPGRGYNVVGNNCMNAAYDVIASFSGSNGNPSVPNQYFPNSWYNGLSVPGGWSNAVAM